jgi:hypothetical protein
MAPDIATHLLGRCGAHGGEVVITDNDKREMDRSTMRESGECYVFDDERIWHMLTPVAVLEGTQYAYRDTLAFDSCQRAGGTGRGNDRHGIRGIDHQPGGEPTVREEQMQWTLRGAHLLLQTRTKVLNNELEEVFRHWYPRFRTRSA